MPSLVVNFTFTARADTPIVAASMRRISSRCGPSFGASQITVASTCVTLKPCSSRNTHTWDSRSSESASRQRSSVSGKCWPMSPSPAAPSSASITAWVSASASEWPASPRSAPGTSTPPSTSRRPASRRCES